MQEIESELIVSKPSRPKRVKKEYNYEPYAAPKNWYVKRGKRSFEIILLTLIALPLSLMITVIFVSLLVPNKGKPVFRQRRIGINGKPFYLYKFRTLSNSVKLDLEKDTAVISSNSHPIGIFLRKTGFDELLQIINVVKGEMSLIGPRPLILNDLKHLTEYQFKRRHSVKPGILGLWQIRRKYVDDKNYFKYDNFYMKKQSLTLDIYIVRATFLYVLKRRGR